jgi:enoyl-CoA hydratase
VNTEIEFTQKNNLGLITLNRPEALNALNLPMILAMQDQLSAWEVDPSISMVLICAAKGKAFCAGGDVRWLYEAGKNQNPQQIEFFKKEYRLNYTISQFPKPYIAIMDGITMGGGVGISLHSAYPIATENFIFAMPETTIGFFPDIGASHLLSRCAYEYGVYLGLTGQRINCDDALQLDLVRTIISSQYVDSLIEQLAEISKQGNIAQEIDEVLKQHSIQPQTELKHTELIAHYFKSDTIEELFHALQKDGQPFLNTLLCCLQEKSFLSLKVTLKQLKKAKYLNLADCLKMDFCLVNNFMKGRDFYEGVRALLIDKDKKPLWEFSNLNEITNATIDKYFQCEGELILL